MNAIMKRKLKGQMLDLLMDKGFEVSCTDTPVLCFFTDKPVNKSSKQNIINGKQYGFITSFGVRTAEKILNGEIELG